jgi:hypothetical protein
MEGGSLDDLSRGIVTMLIPDFFVAKATRQAKEDETQRFIKESKNSGNLKTGLFASREKPKTQKQTSFGLR